jgi:hypothetical protein
MEIFGGIEKDLLLGGVLALLRVRKFMVFLRILHVMQAMLPIPAIFRQRCSTPGGQSLFG